MLQFYFLSVLLNMLIGLVLVYGKAEAEDDLMVLEDDRSFDGEFSDTEEGGTVRPAKNGFSAVLSRFFGKGSFTDDAMFYLVAGFLSVFVALIKLLSAVNGPFLFGDLLPALAGFAGGASVLVQFFEMKSSTSLNLAGGLKFVLVEGRRYVGFSCILIGLVHFVLPGVIFL